ncbi:hypothetical protein F0562_011651 [Nyssa sinensis]|uniref:Cellulose synthase-like protein G3 n=1 Tax=Nyssa sinensis TaxID=561372 RepID=A0A5J4ZTH4_9ASTE|nr:hypothetical protein F0562_011651 [Nyssa sinensis]
MAAKTRRSNSTTMQSPALHTRVALRRTWANRVFTLIYACAVLALLYRHFLNLVYSTTFTITSLAMLLADAVCAFMWATYQGFRMSPIRRQVFPENLATVVEQSDYPALDVFICTADPYKEPPMTVVNTALSVMAYDYPTEKLSVYVSDDGGSQLTLFAFMEAAKFATHWLPYCKKNRIVERCPEVYFRSDPSCFPETNKIKLMYESMKTRVENAVKAGSVCRDYITDEQQLQAFSKWTDGFTRHDHPSIIQVLLDCGKDKDATGHVLPNLIYVSREKSRTTPHNFKAGALNVLLRVSAGMTNAPVILTLDCDMYSNDPQTPVRALCYLLDPSMDPKLAYVQFPQLFDGINKNDIYGAEFKFEFQIDPPGMDGLGGSIHMGTGCFFRRRAFFGGPSSFVAPESPELSPTHVKTKPIQSREVLALAHHVAGCNYEAQTNWGSKVGYRYGSLVEDLYTGYRLQCQGWKSVFCHPDRAAFLGDAPITLDDLLNQTKRWSMGLLNVSFSKYSPISCGIRALNPLWALCYIHYSLWPIRSIPTIIYAFLPQLALLNSFSIFPKVSDPWFFLYIFLFLGAYGPYFLDYMLAGGTLQGWWNSQRMWMVRGLSSFSFGLVEYLLSSLGVSASGFNVTSKVVDSEQSKRYNQGILEFAVASPMFLPITMAAIINLFSFSQGILQVSRHGGFEALFLQILIAGFAVVNSWPVYEAMILRTDKGKMPMKITLISVILVWVLYLASLLTF